LKLLISTIYLTFLFTTLLFSQDGHFTQFYNIPAYANPALVGTSHTSYRVSTIYRDQWFSAINEPLTSFAFAGDLKFDLGGDNNYPDFVGVGIMFFNDKVNSLDFTTNQISISGSYTKLLDKSTQQYLSLGLQTSIQTKSIGYGKLFFGDQFNSIDGFTNPTMEELTSNNLGFFDLSLGLNYSGELFPRHKFNIGLSAFHILSPNISFYNTDEILMNRNDSRSLLPTRFSIHGNYKYSVKKNMSSETRFYINRQLPFHEINVSHLLSFYNPKFPERYFFAGPGLRATKVNDEQFGIESFNVTAGVNYNKIVVSASFDQPISPVIRNRRNFSSFEISFILFGDYDNQVDICPKF
jgi:type IX secretion system PorP/SprF family membrane protein